MLSGEIKNTAWKFPSFGWVSEPKVEIVQDIKVGIDSYENFDTNSREWDIIKKELVQVIAKELYSKNLIEFYKNYDSFSPYKTSYIATMKAIPPKENQISKVEIQENYYILREKRFNVAQIDEALYNTFPEYFI